MNITFNTSRSGLGNNGGSRTIIRCAEILASMGHNVTLYSPVYRYGWHKISGPRISNTPPEQIDLLISASYNDVLVAPGIKAKHKIYYIRGFEIWKASVDQLVDSYQKNICIVNSSWLKDMLAGYGVRAELVYQGLDFDWFKDMGGPRNNWVGAIYHLRHKSKRHLDAQRLSRDYGFNFKYLNRDILNVGPRLLNKWYNKLKIWFAPTELEGLHNPPMEAAMAGCAVVCTDHPRCGMTDYVVDGETAMVYPARDLRRASEHIRVLLDDEDLRRRLNQNMVLRLKSHIGSRRSNMAKLLKFVGGL